MISIFGVWRSTREPKHCLFQHNPVGYDSIEFAPTNLGQIPDGNDSPLPLRTLMYEKQSDTLSEVSSVIHSELKNSWKISVQISIELFYLKTFHFVLPKFCLFFSIFPKLSCSENLFFPKRVKSYQHFREIQKKTLSSIISVVEK